MGIGGQFSRVRWEPGWVIHKSVGEAGKRYGRRGRGVVAQGVGGDHGRYTYCGKELPVYGTAQRTALRHTSALRWTEVNCPHCLGLRFQREPPPAATEGDCACGHGHARHADRREPQPTLCYMCLALGWPGRCAAIHPAAKEG
jgi:hypothetical protein